MRPENMTILTVDDTPANIRLLTHYLEKQGYRVITAEDGFEGFKAAIQHHPDLVLLDVMMPGTDGYEVCELLKAEEETRDIPIMFLTAKADVEDRVRGFELGAVDYITKPFNLVEISTRVKTQLRLQHLEKLYREHRKVLLDVHTLASLGRSAGVVLETFLKKTEALQEHLQKLSSSEKGNTKACSEIQALVNEMFSMLSSLKAMVHPPAYETEKVRILDLLDHVIELVYTFIPNTIRINVDWPKQSWVVVGNMALLHQIFLNALMNAVESGGGKGEISISFSEGPLPEALASARSLDTSQSYIRIAVSDIAPRKEPVEFDPQSGWYHAGKNDLTTSIRLMAIHLALQYHQGALLLEKDETGKMITNIFLPLV